MSYKDIPMSNRKIPCKRCRKRYSISRLLTDADKHGREKLICPNCGEDLGRVNN